MARNQVACMEAAANVCSIEIEESGSTPACNFQSATDLQSEGDNRDQVSDDNRFNHELPTRRAFTTRPCATQKPCWCTSGCALEVRASKPQCAGRCRVLNLIGHAWRNGQP